MPVFMNRLLFSVLLLISSQILFAQVTNRNVLNRPLEALTSETNWRKAISNNDYENIEGTNYLEEDWSEGELRLIDGHGYGYFPINYDLIRGEIHVKHPEGGFMVMPSEAIAFFVLKNAKTGRERIFKPIPDTETGHVAFNTDFGGAYFYEVLYEGAFGLYKLEEKKIQWKREDAASVGAHAKDKFVSQVSYYFKNKDQEYFRIRLSKAFIMRILPEYKSEIKAFVKETGQSLSKEYVVVELLGSLEN